MTKGDVMVRQHTSRYQVQYFQSIWEASKSDRGKKAKVSRKPNFKGFKETKLTDPEHNFQDFPLRLARQQFLLWCGNLSGSPETRVAAWQP